jgi:hypothetical protein
MKKKTQNTVVENQNAPFNIFKAVVQNDPNINQLYKKGSIIRKLYNTIVHGALQQGNIITYPKQKKSPSFKKDKTRFSFLGMNYSKGRIALEVVKQYIHRENPTLQELKDMFPDELTGNSKTLGLIIEVSQVKDKKRYFMDTVFKTRDGKKIVVSSQFGIKNIMPIVNKGIGLGMQIEKIEKR